VSLRVAVVGPGGVGGIVAGALARAGTPVTVVARPETAEAIARDGLRVESVRLGGFTVRPDVVPALRSAVDVCVIAVKAPALAAAIASVQAEPALVVPLLNGVEHVARLRERFGERAVAGSIRIAAERVAPGHVVHTSPALRIELAPDRSDTAAFVHALRAAEIPATTVEREADVLWSKLVRLCPLALSTAASGLPIGSVLDHPRWRLLLQGAVDETAAVARAEGATADAARTLEELGGLEPDQTSSLARDVAEGADHELDAIGGAVLRAAARHGLDCPSVAELAGLVRQRVA
jgi:2-dehydropantoate 2-reductase